jgi:uncharacterized damage-inducible protein DinB
MSYRFDEAVEVLERTPGTLGSLLRGLSDEWVYANEGEGSWSPFDVVGHLIDGENNAWLPRIELILSNNESKDFQAFDRFNHLQLNKGKTMEQLLDEFTELRAKSIEKLKKIIQPDTNLTLTGNHPEFGSVTLEQLLATWTAHDLSHIAQITRVMANRYKIDVGPWKVNLRVMK